MSILTMPFIRAQVIIGPVVLSSSVPTVSSIIDMIGNESVDFIAIGGSWSKPVHSPLSSDNQSYSLTSPILLEHGDSPTGDDFVPVPDAYLYSTEAAATINMASVALPVGIRLATGKRYARATISPTNVVSQLAPVVARALDPMLRDLFLGDFVGEVVDTDGFSQVEFTICLGSFTPGAGSKLVLGIGLEGSTSPSGPWFDVLDHYLTEHEASLGESLTLTGSSENTAQRIGYRSGSPNAKRYVRLDFTAFSPVSGDTWVIGATAEKVNLPPSPAYSLIALLRSRRTL
jgi:hypothetical protein